jgi:hypothetical protein
VICPVPDLLSRPPACPPVFSKMGGFFVVRNLLRRLRVSTGERCSLRAPQFLRKQEARMGRGILLWLIGIPIPLIILILLFWS